MKQFFGADDIENHQVDWKDFYDKDFDESSNSSLTPGPVYSLQSTPDAGLTIGKLVARILNKNFTEKESFWVNLRKRDVYCYDPCPIDGNCCQVERPRENSSDYSYYNYYDYSDYSDYYDYYDYYNYYDYYYGSYGAKSTKTHEKTVKTVKKYSWLTWMDNENYKKTYNFTLVQDYTEPQEPLNCGALEVKDMKIEELDFFGEKCKAKHRPLCMRSTNPNSQIEINYNLKKIKKAKKRKEKRRKNKKKNTKRGKQSLGRQKRQLTDTGRPIEMCATVLPALIGNDNNNLIAKWQ